MSLKLFLLTFTLVLSFQYSLFAEEPTSKAEKAALEIFDGSSAGYRYRDQHKPNGDPTADQAQYRMDLKLAIPLTSDGRLKLKARILSGSSYESSWNNSGQGNHTKYQNELGV